MPASQNIFIREMRKDDLSQALDLSVSEGWNQTVNDWLFLLEDPKNVCIVAADGDKVAGTATAITYGSALAWIGMVLVDKSMRGQGAGRMLMENIIGRLGHIQCIKLDATPAGEPLYRKLGFIPEYRIFRMTSAGPDISSHGSEQTYTENINSTTLPGIIKTDMDVLGTERGKVLSNLHRNFPGRALCMKEKGIISGYIFGRAGTRFNYMGPLSASNEYIARGLIIKAIESAEGDNFALDVPEDKAGFISWLESIGFITQRNFVRMHLSVNHIGGNTKNQYLISGPEFG